MLTDTMLASLATRLQTTTLNIRREYAQHLFLSYFYQIRGVKAPGFRHGDETPPASVNRRGKTVA